MPQTRITIEQLGPARWHAEVEAGQGYSFKRSQHRATDFETIARLALAEHYTRNGLALPRALHFPSAAVEHTEEAVSSPPLASPAPAVDVPADEAKARLIAE